MRDYSIGIDIGGTKIAGAIVDRQGNIIHKRICETPSESKERVLQVLANLVIEFHQLVEKENIRLVGIGVGSAGQINFNEGIILSGTDNIHGWYHVEVCDYLKQFTTLPIFLDNDVNTFTIAEYQLGSARGIENLVCLTLGTGIGGGVIAEGSMLRGEWGGAAELGHMSVNMYGPSCNCGSRGCLETYASGTGIANRMRERLQNNDSLADWEVALYRKNQRSITSKDVFEWKELGASIATEVAEEALQALAYGMMNMIHTFNPTAIILGGGLIDGNRDLVPAVQKRVSKLGMASLVQPVTIRSSSLGEDTGLIGAALQVWM
ncbi:ROK family protein [Aquibacillus sp. 3ASR75-11]|uniref:ROK family protein n=1 Tax=Terrihalobacillus insolitus TaxID=2950438 RepID=A0A9X3WW75_9BACI|nr:ROK family protein [Terrihalobacillus insolitus]MDC3413809.1 ROK family protein [Terrihalobacillus insolitus]MDC3424544.1 ROK family protein [Terrihalobacillus insolitus]